MNKLVKRLLWIIGIILFILVLFLIFNRKGDDGIKVAAEKISRRTIIETVNASGKIFSEVEVKITPDISGEITDLYVNEGDSVVKGQLLAKIYADIYATSKDQATAQLNQQTASTQNYQYQLNSLKSAMDLAKKNYDRQQQLLQSKVISPYEAEQAQNQYQTAKANYESMLETIKANQAAISSAQASVIKANKDLSRTTIIAPMSGIVSSLNIKKGERVSGNSFTLGTEMMTIADMSVIEVRVNVGENDIIKVHLGDSVDVDVDAYNNRKFLGIVTKIAPSSGNLSSSTAAVTNDVANYKVHIRLIPSSYEDLLSKNGTNFMPFRPGMNVSVDIKTKQLNNVVAVPIRAVTTRLKGKDETVQDKKKELEKLDNEKLKNDIYAPKTTVDYTKELESVVFVVLANNTVEKAVVKTGIQDQDYFEVVSGLAEGKLVVTDPYSIISKSLKNGDKIKIVEREKLYIK